MNDFLIDRFFGFARTIHFLPKRWRYSNGTSRPKMVPENVPPTMEALRSDRIVVFPEFIDKQTVATMVDNLPDIEQFETSIEGDRSQFFLNAHTLPGLSPFFENRFIRDVAMAYIGEDAIPLRRSVEYKHHLGSLLSFDRMYHMDSWKHRLKAFLYLSDVGPDQAQ